MDREYYPAAMVKVSFATNLDGVLVERARDAVVALSTEHPTLAGLVTVAITRELARLERKHGPIPARKVRKLRPGRRVS